MCELFCETLKSTERIGLVEAEHIYNILLPMDIDMELRRLSSSIYANYLLDNSSQNYTNITVYKSKNWTKCNTYCRNISQNDYSPKIIKNVFSKKSLMVIQFNKEPYLQYGGSTTINEIKCQVIPLSNFKVSCPDNMLKNKKSSELLAYELAGTVYTVDKTNISQINIVMTDKQDPFKQPYYWNINSSDQDSSIAQQYFNEFGDSDTTFFVRNSQNNNGLLSLVIARKATDIDQT